MAVVLSPDVARWRYAQSGKQEIYLDVLRQLAEEPTFQGNGLRYGPKTLHDLDVRLTFRGIGHSKVLFQLCHFVRAAAVIADRPTAWLDPALGAPSRITGKTMRAHLEDRAGGTRCGPVILDESDIVLDYGAESLVRIAYGVLPRLVVTLDLMLSAGLLARDGEVLTILDGIARGPHDATAVAKSKDRLQAQLDGWLDQVQRSRQELDKFNQLVRFLSDDGKLPEIAFDDASLLAFWQAAAADPESYPGCIRFRTVFLLFTDALAAFQDAEHLVAQRRAAPLGTDLDTGEIEPFVAPAELALDPRVTAGLRQAEPGEQVSWLSPLSRFATPPLVDTDILNGAERERLSILLDAGPAAIPLRRSLLRAELMGAVQAKLTEAERRQSDNDHLVTLAVLDQRRNTKDEFPKSYGAVIEVYERLALHIDRMSKALAYLAYSQGDVELDPETEAKLAGELRQAGRIFDRIAREGFRRLREHPLEVEPFLEAAGLLEPIAHRLREAIKALKALDAGDGLEACLADDRPIFARAFAQIYGDAR